MACQLLFERAFGSIADRVVVEKERFGHFCARPAFVEKEDGLMRRAYRQESIVHQSGRIRQVRPVKYPVAL